MKLKLAKQVYKGVTIHLTEAEARELHTDLYCSNMIDPRAEDAVSKKLMFLLDNGLQSLKAL